MMAARQLTSIGTAAHQTSSNLALNPNTVQSMTAQRPIIIKVSTHCCSKTQKTNKNRRICTQLGNGEHLSGCNGKRRTWEHLPVFTYFAFLSSFTVCALSMSRVVDWKKITILSSQHGIAQHTQHNNTTRKNQQPSPPSRWTQPDPGSVDRSVSQSVSQQSQKHHVTAAAAIQSCHSLYFTQPSRWTQPDLGLVSPSVSQNNLVKKSFM
ncbi:hypothetical protein EJ05DRAFT_392237 [Pseudovirgaria hyperparasitica]|uniref:Uncharacterized protein n=1 Tax=Pseudovirgaria hyperparasitica TaxID=470096 RepID=A0A6A6W7F3_9PEZI|nr:uncharacterized protein EJ05DRAFT_392237 [Pseudovirgaria hyperparasitica]KAF2757507.1 hypothetical protein EJ05DRAFT_392237 [Pseudovirgaria hyperparasitica]